MLGMHTVNSYQHVETKTETSCCGWHEITAPEAVASTVGPPATLVVFRILACAFLIFGTYLHHLHF